MNRATARRTASEKDAGKMDGRSPRVFSLAFPSSRLSSLSERLEQATVHNSPYSMFHAFLSRVDDLNKLACLQCMGLHSSDGRALQHERRGHGFESH